LSQNQKHEQQLVYKYNITMATLPLPIPVLLVQLSQQVTPVLEELVKVLEEDMEAERMLQPLKRLQEVLDIVDEMMHPNGNNNPPNNRKFVKYDRERATIAIYQDYMRVDPKPIFNDQQFKRMFRVSKRIYGVIKTSAMRHPFFASTNHDASGREPICIDAKLLTGLKHLAYGTSFNTFRDYFQMGEATSQLCFMSLMQVLSTDLCLKEKYFRNMTRADTKRVLALHEEQHGVPGMLGSVDCMHVSWKNCPYEWQGSWMGKHDNPTIVVEAACDHNLWFWHASVGYPGALNDINVFDLSSLSKKMVDGTLEATDVMFAAGNDIFSKNYFLADGIYPSIGRIVKTIAVPVNAKERYFARWQEAARKDIERAFGVLVRRFMFLNKPIELHKIDEIKNIMYVCLLLHNMLVEERTIDHDNDDDFYLQGYALNDEDEDEDATSELLEGENMVNMDMADIQHRREVLAEMQQLNQGVVDVELCIMERRNRFLDRSMQLIQKRFDKLYDRNEYNRLQRALVEEVYSRKE
jgi:Plant transposon protein